MRALVVQGYGKSIGYRDGSIVVREKGRTVGRYAPGELDQVVVIGSASISTPAIRALSEAGCDVLFISWRGELYARLSFPEMRTVATRREQYAAYDDERGGHIAREVLRAKLRNQYYYLMTLQKLSSGEKAEAIARERELIRACLDRLDEHSGRPDDVREALLGLEGEAASAYFRAISRYLPEGTFDGRTGRGATDPVNSMLNYGYAVLMGAVWRGVHMAGLDPYAGYLHADRPGKPSLVLDLMEMFRTQVVDRVVVQMVRDGAPTGDWRTDLAERVISRLSERVYFRDSRLELSQVAVVVSRELAAYLRGERSGFEGFYLSW
ncbi:MAG: CRISPR-associated endonuclease Cas1 [Nitrososphaeria archaeon]